VFQTTRNPWNLDLTSGGSSAGSAVAVATGMAPIAAGSDGGGSVRIPAALCGVVGFKPSMGRVPLYPSCRDERYPGASGWESIEHLGPLTRTVADAALVLSVIAGPDDRDRHSLPAVGTDWVAVCKEDGAGLRIGYSPAFEAIDVDPDVSSVAADAVTIFETCLGGTIELVKPDFDAFAWAFLGIVMLESDLTGMRDLAKRHRGEMSPYLVDLLSRQWTAEELSRAVVARKAVANKMWQLMRNFDLFITPTVATPAFPIDLMGPSTVNGKKRAVEDWAPFTWPMNFTGQPAISVPAGFTPSGLPVGIQISGRHLDDAGVLRAAAAFERVRPWRHHWPGIVRNTTKAALSPTI
jgi:aspartyl-tRNA(Asn)/glutamyl-tRNA(Gln) amidotransferase subunit A